jgi:hypothetical protein
MFFRTAWWWPTNGYITRFVHNMSTVIPSIGLNLSKHVCMKHRLFIEAPMFQSTMVKLCTCCKSECGLYTRNIASVPFKLSHCPFHTLTVSFKQMLRCVGNIDSMSFDIHLSISSVLSICYATPWKGVRPETLIVTQFFNILQTTVESLLRTDFCLLGCEAVHCTRQKNVQFQFQNIKKVEGSPYRPEAQKGVQV